MGDPVLAQLNIKVGIGEARSAPMLLDDDTAGFGAEALAPFPAQPSAANNRVACAPS